MRERLISPDLPERSVVCRATPSLALIKYWGKRRGGFNIPATTSIAVTLSGLESIARVRLATQDRVVIADDTTDTTDLSHRHHWPVLLNALRRATGYRDGFDIKSRNTFATAAGLASSSSGFAAVVCAAVAATGVSLSLSHLSRLARIGSGSAARAIYGGFTMLSAGCRSARQIFDAGHWPELRLLVAITEHSPKKISSREAMQLTRSSSPYYNAWTRSSRQLAGEARQALGQRDLPRLGQAMRCSYLRMFAVMMAAQPPILYWYPESLTLIRLCGALREQGLTAWETMDAGPQVKIITTCNHLATVRQQIEQSGATVEILEATVGDGPRVEIAQ